MKLPRSKARAFLNAVCMLERRTQEAGRDALWLALREDAPAHLLTTLEAIQGDVSMLIVQLRKEIDHAATHHRR
jgi:hypothetical protein